VPVWWDSGNMYPARFWVCRLPWNVRVLGRSNVACYLSNFPIVLVGFYLLSTSVTCLHMCFEKELESESESRVGDECELRRCSSLAAMYILVTSALHV
jgi:hypothetical protein